MAWAAAALTLSGLEEVSWRRWDASSSPAAATEAHLALLAEGRLTALTGELWVFTSETLPLSPPGTGAALSTTTAIPSLLPEIDSGTARPALAPPTVWHALAHALQVRVGRALCERGWSAFAGLYVCTRALSPSSPSSSALPACQLSFVAHTNGTIVARVRFSSRNVRFPLASDFLNKNSKKKPNDKARVHVITSPYGTPAALVARASAPVIAELKRRNNVVDGESNNSYFEVRWASDGSAQPPLLFPAHALLLPRVDTLPPFTRLRRCWLGDSGACEWVEDSILAYAKGAPTSLRGDDNESTTSSSGRAGADEAEDGDSSSSSSSSEDEGDSDADSGETGKASQSRIAQGSKLGSLTAPESQKRATGKRTRSGLSTDMMTRMTDNSTAHQDSARKAEQQHLATTLTSAPNHATTYTSPWGDPSLDAVKTSGAVGADSAFDDYDIDKIELADLGDFGNIDDIAFNDIFDDGPAEKSGHTAATTLYAFSTPGTDSNVNVGMMAASPATSLYARTLTQPEGVSALSMLMAPTPPDDRPSMTPHAGVGTPSSFVGTPGNPYTPAPAFTPAHCVATPAVPEPAEDEVVTVPSWIVDMPAALTSHHHWHAASLGSTRGGRDRHDGEEDYERCMREDARGYCPEEYVCRVAVRGTSRGQEYAYDPGAYVKAFCAKNVPKRGLTYAGHFTPDGSAVTDVSRKAEAVLPRSKPAAAASHAATSASAITAELSPTTTTATHTPDAAAHPSPSALVAVLATEAELLRRHQLALATDSCSSSGGSHATDACSPAQLAGLSHNDIAAASCLLAQQTVATFDLALDGPNMEGPLAFLASRMRMRSHQLSVADLVTEPDAMDPPDPLFAELAPTLASNLLRADVVPAFVTSLGESCAHAHATLADCADSVTPLRTPLLLAGFHEDWLQVSPDTLQLWDKAPLEPYASPKPVAYQVLCPSIGSLTNAAAEFFHELTAVYEVCNLGSHSANAGVNGADAHGIISVDVGNVDSNSNLVRLGPTQVEAYRASLHKACTHIAQATNTGKPVDPEHDTAHVLYVVLPLTDAKSTLDIVADVCHHLAPPPNAVARGVAGVTSLTVQFLSPEQVMRAGSMVHVSPASLKNVAFSVYAKIRRMPRNLYVNHSGGGGGMDITTNQDSGGNAAEDAFASIVPSPLPFPIPSTANAANDESSAPALLYEPFAILADASAAPDNAVEPPAFHCSYAMTQSGRWVVSVWTDARGELLDTFVTFAGASTAHGEAAPLTPQDEFAMRWSPGMVVSDAPMDSAARLAHSLRAILRQGFELLRSADTSVPRRLVITSLGQLTAADREAWQAALSSTAGLQAEGVSCVCVCAMPAAQSNIQLLPAIEANAPTSLPSHPLTARFPFVLIHAGYSPTPPLHADLTQAKKTRMPSPVLASAHIVAPPSAAMPDHAIRPVSDWPSVLGLELIVYHIGTDTNAVDEDGAKSIVKRAVTELYALAWLRTSFLPLPHSRSLLPMHAIVTARLHRLVQYYDEEYRPLL